MSECITFRQYLRKSKIVKKFKKLSYANVKYIVSIENSKGEVVSIKQKLH